MQYLDADYPNIVEPSPETSIPPLRNTGATSAHPSRAARRVSTLVAAPMYCRKLSSVLRYCGGIAPTITNQVYPMTSITPPAEGTVAEIYARGLRRSVAVALALLAPAEAPFAAGWDCTRATLPAEQAVCASDELRRLDAELTVTYQRLTAALPQQRPALRAAQSAWLKTRDQCGANPACIEDRYRSRVAELQARLVAVVAYRSDDQDIAARDELRARVDAERQQDPVFALDRVIAQLRVTAGATTFSNVAGGADSAAFPTVRPKGITQDEWKALLASHIDGGGANGGATYTLVDLDGDGQRDLIIDTDLGGTGVWSSVSALRRHGNRFEGRYNSGGDSATAGGKDDGTGQSSLYTINGRGANQSADWVRLHGRIYAAYRDSHYGEDDVYLVRPFTVVDEVPVLTIRYRYQLSVPRVQPKDDRGRGATLDTKLQAALTRALYAVSDGQARDAGADKPICPIPASVKGDARESYLSYGPGHYTFEIVGDMPIYVGHDCYLGRFVDWFGSYRKDGLAAEIWMKKPGDGEDDREQIFSVRGVRTAVGTKSSIGRMPNESGA